MKEISIPIEIYCWAFHFQYVLITENHSGQKAEFFSVNPLDANHSVPYNENNYFSLSTYRLLTSLPVHGIGISLSVGGWAKLERWKVLLSQSEFRYTHWQSFRLLKIFIMRRNLWILFSEMHQYLWEQIFFLINLIKLCLLISFLSHTISCCGKN